MQEACGLVGAGLKGGVPHTVSLPRTDSWSERRGGEEEGAWVCVDELDTGDASPASALHAPPSFGSRVRLCARVCWRQRRVLSGERGVRRREGEEERRFRGGEESQRVAVWSTGSGLLLRRALLLAHSLCCFSLCALVLDSASPRAATASQVRDAACGRVSDALGGGAGAGVRGQGQRPRSSPRHGWLGHLHPGQSTDRGQIKSISAQTVSAVCQD